MNQQLKGNEGQKGREGDSPKAKGAFARLASKYAAKVTAAAMVLYGLSRTMGCALDSEGDGAIAVPNKPTVEAGTDAKDDKDSALDVNLSDAKDEKEDADKPDAGPDAKEDAEVDAPEDVALDVEPDVAESGVDAKEDAEPDAMPDVLDAGEDVEETGVDAGEDAADADPGVVCEGVSSESVQNIKIDKGVSQALGGYGVEYGNEPYNSNGMTLRMYCTSGGATVQIAEQFLHEDPDGTKPAISTYSASRPQDQPAGMTVTVHLDYVTNRKAQIDFSSVAQ